MVFSSCPSSESLVAKEPCIANRCYARFRAVRASLFPGSSSVSYRTHPRPSNGRMTPVGPFPPPFFHVIESAKEDDAQDSAFKSPSPPAARCLSRNVVGTLLRDLGRILRTENRRQIASTFAKEILIDAKETRRRRRRRRTEKRKPNKQALTLVHEDVASWSPSSLGSSPPYRRTCMLVLRCFMHMETNFLILTPFEVTFEPEKAWGEVTFIHIHELSDLANGRGRSFGLKKWSFFMASASKDGSSMSVYENMYVRRAGLTDIVADLWQSMLKT